MKDEMKRKKAYERRYQKALVREINFESILQTTLDIQTECEELSYYENADFESLADALGDEDEASEFKMMFHSLSADCQNLYYDLQEQNIPECFDDFFVAVNGADYGNGLMGYDSYEYDYYGLDDFASSLAEQESQKRILRLTKSEIISAAQRCFKIFMAFVGVRNRYYDLKAAIDILKDKHSGFIQTVRQIEDLYEKAEKEYFWGEYDKQFDRLLSMLPDEVWIQ